MGPTSPTYREMTEAPLLSEELTLKILRVIVDLKIEAKKFSVFKECELNRTGELLLYIQYLGSTPPDGIHLTPYDYIRLYSWLDELRLYHNYTGKLNEISQFNEVFGYNPDAAEENPEEDPNAISYEDDDLFD